MAAYYGNLKEYDMVLAVDQNTINDRLSLVFGGNNRTQEITDFLKWELPIHDDTNPEQKVEVAKLVCEFEAPYIDFNTDVDNGCRLNLRVKSGKYKYLRYDFSLQKPVWKEEPLDNIVFSITSNMSTKEELKFSDEVFTVQALTLRLQEVTADKVAVNLSETVKVHMISQGVKTDLQTTVATEVKAQAEQYEKKYQKPLLLLGKVKVPKVRKTKGPLAPLASKYSVFKQLDENGTYIGGSLNYLLLVDNDEDPTNPAPKLPTDPTAGRFGENLVLPGKSGSLLISDETLIRTFVVPAISKKYNTTASRFSYERNNNKCIASLRDLPYDGGKFEHINLKVEGDTVRGDYVYKKTKDYWAGDIHATATGYFAITFQLDGERIVSKTVAPEPHIDTDNDLVGRIFAGIFTLGFNEIGVKVESDNLRDNVDSIEDNLQASISQALDCIELPGDAVFKYKDIGITNACRLRLGLSYEEQIVAPTETQSMQALSPNETATELTYAPQGNWAQSQAGSTINYLSWDNNVWGLKIEGDTFAHAPQGDWDRSHSATIINYISWDKNSWTAKLDGKTFTHAPQGDWSKSHSSDILNYVDANGSPWTLKVA